MWMALRILKEVFTRLRRGGKAGLGEGKVKEGRNRSRTTRVPGIKTRGVAVVEH